MFSKNNRQMNQQKQGEKVTRYAIKKFSFGAASVAVACGIYFANGPAVQAESQDNVTTTSLDHEVASETSHQPAVQAASLDQAADATPASSASSDQASAPAASESSAAESSSQKEEPATSEGQADQASSEKPDTPAAPAQQAATSPASSAEQPTANTEVTQPSRSRRVRRDATPTGLRDGDPNNTIAKPTLADSEKKRPADLMKQINWLDFSDSKSLTNLDANGAFQVGTVYEKEISPGYRIKLTVTSLKPFHSTEIYRDRVKGTEHKDSYDPDAKNTWLPYKREYSDQQNKGDDYRPKIIGSPQNRWTAIKEQGIDTKGRKTQLQVPKDGANYGVTFKVEATYLGKPVKATVVMADGEEANPGEYAIFTTNGQGWEHLAEWKRVSPNGTAITETYAPTQPNTDGQYIGNDGSGVHWYAYTNPDQRTGGLGSQVFGPNTSKHNTVPVVMTRGASEVGIYIASSGQQAAMIGFMVVDEGDAPESYGKAVHAISGYDAETGARNPQPYLGRVAADIDTSSGGDWTHDDNTDHADEGIKQLLPDDLVNQTHNLFRADRLRDGNYSVRFHANSNGNAKAYVRAWMDFNQNGKFDDNEASDFTEVTGEGDFTVNFRNHPPMTNDQVNKIGMRIRIALNQGDIEKPTGTAFSGEVEDLEVLLTYPPKGEKKETFGLQGQQQKATLHFTPRGVDKNDENAKAAIDTNKAPIVLDNTGQTLTPNGEGWYTTTEGRYKITADGADVNVVFEPAAGFTGKAAGINIRRFDTNGSDTNWTAKNNAEAPVSDTLNTMDARYVPNVLKHTENVSTDAQGLPQEKDIVFNDGDPANTPVQPSASNPATFLDADGNPVSGTSIPATSGGKEVGTFNLDPVTGRVTFTPNKSFVGTVDPVNLQVNDASGQPHRATYQPKVTPVVPTGQNASSEGIQGAEQSGNLVFTPGDSRVPIDEAVAPTFDNGKSTKEVPGVGTYTVDNTGRVTFQPLPGYTGRPNPETVKRVDKNGTEVTATYTPTVTKVTPTSTDDTSEGVQGQPQKGTPTFSPGNPEVPIDLDSPMTFEDGQPTKTVQGVGVYTINPDGSITFTPDKQYVGTPDPVVVKRVDKNGTEVTAKYTPTVTKVTPTSTNAESSGIQGQPQKGTPTFTEGNPLVPIDDSKPMTFEDGSSTKTVPNVGVYTINPDGSITFTPDKQYVGTPAPVTVKRVDKNGTEVTATYTPTVTKVTPTSKDDTSTGVQGQPQTGTPVFTPGDPAVPIDLDSQMTFEDGQPTKTVPGVGEYSINPDGSITFTPDKQYVGTPDPVVVKRVDKNGTEVTAKYTPTVTRVTPTSTNDTSEGVQGQPQKGTPTFTAGDPLVPLDDTKPMTFEDGSSTKKVPNVGEYSINPDGSITFTPDKQYVGTPAPVTVKRVDKNGTEVTATYTPTVTKVTPTSKDDTSTGVQGIPQTGTPVFTPGDPAVPIDLDSPMTFEDGQPKKIVPGVGEYSINPDGSITFTPDKQYVGTPAPVTVKRVDKNGTEVTAQYTPTVTKVTPTSKDDTSTGVQGVPQTGTPVFTPGDPAVPIDLDSPLTFEDGSSTKSVPGVGEYSINPDGSITFTPDKQYVGTPAPVTVKRVDKNGTPVTANYTPTVTRVTPTSQDATSTGAQGLPQSGTPSFTPGDPAIPIDMDSPMTFEDGQTTKSVPGVGEYSINPDGSITFTPEKRYVGTPAAVVVKRVDKNGTPVTAQYTPTVTPVTPTSEDVSSTGLQGQKQTGTPTFTPGNPEVPMDDTVPMTFEDGSTTKSVPGVGEYSINPDGSITFTPDKQFVGKPDPVRVKRVDKNGTPVTADYQVEVTRVTPTSTPATSTGLQGQPQTGSPVFKEGAPEVPMDDTVPMTFEDGSTTKSVPGVGEYSINPDGSITFTPDKQFVGTPDPVTVKRVDKNGTPVTATYTPTVTKVTPTSTPATSTGLQGQPQTGSPSFTPGDPVVPMDDTVPMTFEDGSSTKTVPNVGVYTINPDGSITFTPDKQYVGTPDPVTVKRVDKNGTPVTATYTPTVTKVTPTSTPATSTGAQGLPQSGTPSFTPGDPVVPMDDTIPMTFEDGSSTKTVPNVGVYTINPDGSITFTPEKQFVGTPDPVTVKRVDKNGTPVTATYTPTVTKVTPTSTPATSTGLQGQPQSGSPVFTPGNPEVPMDDTVPMTFEDGSTTKSIPGVGEYSLNPDGSITFTPDKQFVGSPDPVTVKRVDKNGTPVTATYTPTVTKVTPTSTPATSTGTQGYKQSGKPVFTPGASVVPMDDTVPMTFEDGTTTKTVIGEGVYTIQADGSIEFVPEKTFTGQGSQLTVKRVDKNGTPVTATYQATVIPVKPGANNDYSSGVVNQAQMGQVKFVPGSANINGTEQSVDLVPGSLKFVVNGQAVADTTIPALDQAGNQVGTYSLAQDGTVTFTPNPGYVGQPVPARVQATDVNGTTAEATYSPVVNASVTSEGMKGQSQSKLPDFKGQVDPKVPAYLEGGVTSVTVPGQGTYTVNPETGEVTFTPEPDFIGQASPITVIRRDVNGKELKIQYIPTVYGQVKTQDTTSTGYPGEKQTGTPVFEGDVDLTIPATFENGQTELTVPGEGTYVLNPDGSVTFTPEAGFLGQASGVTVVRVDRNGRKVTAQYVPTVVPVPVAPSEPEVQRQGLLPATGEAPDYSFFSGVALTILASVGLVATRKRQATDED